MTYTANNWLTAPINRRSFQNVQGLFPTIRIRRSNEAIVPLIRARKPYETLGDIAFETRWAGQSTVGQMLATNYTDALIVLKHGEVVYENYLNGMGPDSFHLLNSVTKSLTGTLACILIDQGYFGIDDPVIKHLPELEQTALAESTVRHLMDMSAAVAYGEDYNDPKADFWIESAMVGWRPDLTDLTSATHLAEYAQTLQASEQENGEKFHYRTVLTNLIGMLISRTTQMPLGQVMQEHLWSALTPEQDLAIVVDALGQPYVGAGGNACARDLARFGQMIVQQGTFNDKQVVSSKWIDDTRYATDHSRELFASSDYGNMMPGGHYRNQFWVQDAERGVLLAIGIFGQVIHMNMSTGVVSVKFSTFPTPDDAELFQDAFLGLLAISENV